MDLFSGGGGGGVYWPLSMVGVDKGWEINSRCPYCWRVGGGGVTVRRSHGDGTLTNVWSQ